MKKTLITLCILGLLGGQSIYAAESLSDLGGVENVGNPQASQSPSQVVILNHNSEQKQDQEQEADTFMSSSVKQKYAARQGWGNGDSLEALRNSRINKEAQNEQILMEKLEESRMEDEKSRIERLFKIREYNRKRHQEMGEDNYEFGDIEAEEASQDPVIEKKIVKVVKVKEVVEAPVVEAVERQKEVAVAPVATTSREKVSSRSLLENGYIKGQLGLGSYEASNTSLEAAWGMALGADLNSRWYAEIGLLKSGYDVNDPYATPAPSQMRSLDQYNVTGLVGLKLISTARLVGSLKGGFSYVRRNSESSDLSGFQPFSSNTLDGTLGIGVDVAMTQNLALTGGFDYYTNLLNDIASTDSDVVERVEHSDYYFLGVGLKLKF